VTFREIKALKLVLWILLSNRIAVVYLRNVLLIQQLCSLCSSSRLLALCEFRALRSCTYSYRPDRPKRKESKKMTRVPEGGLLSCIRSRYAENGDGECGILLLKLALRAVRGPNRDRGDGYPLGDGLFSDW
jgi:hypothetical protein